MNRYAIIISGSRRLTFEKHYKIVLDLLKQYAGADQVIVLHGAQDGADDIAHIAAENLHFVPLPIPYFGHLGKAGGPKRNECVIDLGLTLERHGYWLFMHALPDAESVGTHRALAYAKAKNVRAEVHPQ